MKRTPNLKEVDKKVEAKAHQPKKLKGPRPTTNRISFSSDSEQVISKNLPILKVLE